jgi:murein tripeptide amidase MpaA
MKAQATFVLLVLVCLSTAIRRYDGYSVLRLEIDSKNQRHLAVMQQLNNMHHDDASFWSHSDIQVTPTSFPEVRRALEEAAIPFTVMIENVQDLVDRELSHTAAVRAQEAQGPGMNAGAAAADSFFNDYRNNTEIANWLNSLVASYPNLMTIQKYNVSYEGRDLKVVKLTSQVGVPSSKPIILWEGGIHAREWIGHMTMCYMISKLTRGYGSDPSATSILDNFQVHIIPVVNPDGYEYTWSTDRLWRKTRSPNKGSPCIGTDPNRNWNDHWCEIGASTQPCSDSYCGDAPFSETEVLSVANYVMSYLNTLTRQNQIIEFIDYHSYGQLFMAPYGWTATPPPNAMQLQALGLEAVVAIASIQGTSFAYGQIYTIIYPASGSSADWGTSEGMISYCYGVELEDEGIYGFILPASYIVPQGEEIWASLKATASYFMTPAK